MPLTLAGVQPSGNPVQAGFKMEVGGRKPVYLILKCIVILKLLLYSVNDKD